MPLAGLNILVTRPQGQAANLLAAISAEGGRGIHYPVLAITPLDQSVDVKALQRGKEQVLDIDQYQHLIFISSNAVHFGLEWINQYWPQLPVAVHWYGVGSSTIDHLSREGVAVNVPPLSNAAGAMNSEVLLLHPDLQQLSHQKVLIVRGVGGREYLAQQLSARGAQVDYLECYRRRSPPVADVMLAAVVKQQQIDIICVNSAESLQNVVAMAADQVIAVQQVELLVPGQRVADIARDLGFNKVRMAANASDQAMLSGLSSIAAKRN